MKIIDIMMQSAELLGLKNAYEIMKTSNEENESSALENEEIARLYNLIKFSLQELCTNYVPMVQQTEVTTIDKKFLITSLTNFIRVHNVFLNGSAVKYKIINRYLTMENDGTYLVEYYTYPSIESMFEDIDFLSNFSPDALIFSLCAYYCLAVGLFDEFNEFHDRYIDVAENLKNIRIFNLPQRRWE